MTALPKHLARRARASEDARPAPNLEEITREANRWRDLRLTKDDLEQQLRDVNIKIADLEFTRLPALLDEARVSSLTVETSGNQPAVSLTVKPHYAANIAASWEDDRRQTAFAALEKVGAGDLIKTEVKILLGRKERAQLKKLIRTLDGLGFPPEVKASVHSATLTAYLKEQWVLPEPERHLPPLDLIGAKVSRICQPRFVTEDK